MAHKSITGKRYGVVLSVISLLLIFITVLLFQGCSQKSDLDREVSELNQTVEILSQERDDLKTE
ncbi:MAG TPA: hypothetical protein VK861_04505, partial [Bacteroidales bacterium]|nr:hypothetical protein [Bacteroidales bacterium]